MGLAVPMTSALAATLAYHERTKHRPFRYAASLGYMDWATQPDPFRRFAGAPVMPLDFVPFGPQPSYDDVFAGGRVPPSPVDRTSISQLFQDALALSAWKQAGGARWALRVNPSSGNLHPTEGYLVSGPIAGLHDRPAVYHYAPHEHALERRVDLSAASWSALAAELPPNAILVGLTSIYWREAWKYGERAFRYCHHDVGHAIAACAIAAGGLGWQTRLLESVVDDDLGVLLGVHLQSGVEAEHADCLMAVFPASGGEGAPPLSGFAIPQAVRDELERADWAGTPNRLSRGHHAWPAIDEVAAATTKRERPEDAIWPDAAAPAAVRVGARPVPLRALVLQRRSAVALDGQTRLSREAFYDMLLSVMPGRFAVPFSTAPWGPAVDLLLFVHRVEDVPPGLHFLMREPSRRTALEHAMGRSLDGPVPPGCPDALPLVLLEQGDARRVAEQTSCEQDIAADGAFAVAMLADFRATLERFGPWFYRRLYWETGMIGQVLYLEAEAHGIRGTGIGCFFDDLTHQVFGLADDRFQVLYHFTMGGPLEDHRLQTSPPYAHLLRAPRST
jgi:SagB-type dehydrogenase family enzyme